MILVTGVTGFLGKHVCRKLEKQRLNFHKSSLSLGADLRDASQCDALFSKTKPDFVLHCAAYVGGIQFGLKHQAEMFYNNLMISLNIFECCVKYKVKRLVNPISNCAYPGNATLFKENEFWNGPLHDSVATYGMVRKISHIGALAYRKQYDLDTVNLILSNMYGPDDHFDEERSHALGALIKKIVDAKINNHDSVVVWGTGKPVREWLFVEDGAEAMIRAMDIPPYSDIINIGVSKGISIKDMAEMICDAVKYDGKLVFDYSKEDGAPYKTVDGSCGKEIFKWQPETDFVKGLEKTVNWYTQNRYKG
jgi:GDP-L-fucose synthase